MSDKNCATTVASAAHTAETGPTDLSALHADARTHVTPPTPITPPKVQEPTTVNPQSDLRAARLARPDNIQCLMEPAPEHEPSAPRSAQQHTVPQPAGYSAATQPGAVVPPTTPLLKKPTPEPNPAAVTNTATNRTATTTAQTPSTGAPKSTEYGIFRNPRWPYQGGTLNKIISFFANVLQFIKQILLALLGDTSHKPHLPRPLQAKPNTPPPAPDEALKREKAPKREKLTVHRS